MRQHATKTVPHVVSGSYAVLDAGTSKVSCFIAQVDSAGEIRITGIGHQLSRGIRSGIITDFAEAETSIIAAVHAAEQMAGETVDNVIVALNGGGLSSRHVTVEMSLSGAEVSERDILDIVEQGRASVEAQDADIIHCFPIQYTLDTTKGISDPRQMYGDHLSADLHLVTAPPNLTRNLTQCIARCHLNVGEYVAGAYASGLSVLEQDEKDLGVTVIDLGGGTTSVAVFQGGHCIFADAAPIGGVHVTSDIAKGLSTTLTHAERLKTLHGSCMISAHDDQVMVSAPLLGEDEEDEESNVLPRSMLVGIIRPRIEEIFEMIKGKLEMGGVDQLAGKRVVLTGGGSQLLGVREMAARSLSRQVRLGRPKTLPGLAEAVSGPAFSSSLGMLQHILNKPMEQRLYEASRSGGRLPLKLKGLVRWFKESF